MELAEQIVKYTPSRIQKENSTGPRTKDPVKPRKTQENPGKPRKTQENPRKNQENPGKPTKSRKPRKTKETQETQETPVITGHHR